MNGQTRGPLTGGFRIGYGNGTEIDATTLEWTGLARPDWLRLRYLKNGPGLFSVGTDRYRHWFDGLSLLKQFDIGDEIVFQSRFLQSPDYVTSTRRAKVSFTEFATAPDRTWWERLRCTVDPNAQFGANASINLQEIDGQVVAICDLPGGMTVEPGRLGTTRPFELKKPLLMTSTPHPQRDEARRGWVNTGIGASLKGFGYHVYFLPDGSRHPQPIAFIPRSRPAYLHSIGMSDRYVVLAEHPMFASLPRFFTLGLRNRPVLDAFAWKETEPLTLFIVDKAEKRVAARVEAPTAFTFHSANVFDEGADVVIDLCTYPDDRVMGELFIDRILGSKGGETAPASLVRHRVHLPTGSLTRQTITDASVEFPKVNPHRSHRSYQFTYAVSINPAITNDHSNQLVKVDVSTGEATQWFEAGCYPNEPFMVPRPGATDEDDGVVLSVVLDAKLGASILLILDARSFTEIGRARVPTVIPFGLHGQVMSTDAARQPPATQEPR